MWRSAEEYGRLAEDWVSAYEGDAGAIERLNRYYERQFTLGDVKAEIWRRVYAFRQRSSRVEKNFLLPGEAQLILAQDAGFGNWEALISAAAGGGPAPGPCYNIDEQELKIAPRRRLSNAEWDIVLEVMRERGIRVLDAHGLMTDAVLKKLAGLEQVTGLGLGGSRELSNVGLAELARMPQLERLDLSEYPGGKLTDPGLEVLRHLPNLRWFQMTWQSGITDAGVANLSGCEHLEQVNLMGSPTGDGAIEALQGKARLRQFSTGRQVTERGAALLRNYPALEALVLDGPFGDAGLASLAGIESLQDLDLFWHTSGLSGEGFAQLAALPNLQALGCDGRLSDDTALRHIGALPRLRRLRIQESVASEAGFEALGRSRTIEGIWGRVCENFGERGFAAFSKMPSLRQMGIGLGKVPARALAALPEFPALRELTPIGLGDDGFREVGRCRGLERLTCMYCRESGDAATEHIKDLKITYYYAGLTQITDRSLEILGGMETLEQVEFYECQGVTDAGLPHLARLPKLREVHLDGLPQVTLAGTRVFAPGVRVQHSN